MTVLISDGYTDRLIRNGCQKLYRKQYNGLLFASVFSFRLRLMADQLVGVRAQLPVLKDIPPNELTQAAG